SLLIERNSGIDAGVHEQVVADFDHVFEVLDERDVIGRHGIGHEGLRLFQTGLNERVTADAVAQHRLPTPVPQEMAEHLELAEAAEEHLLVVPREYTHAPPALPLTRQGDYPSAIATAIDQVTEKDHGCVRGCHRSVVCIDRSDERFKQVAPSMDIADGIDTLSGRNGGGHGAITTLENLTKCLKHEYPGDPSSLNGRACKMGA